MNETQLSTPILFITFNRPDTTQKVFNEIRKIKPEKLFIAADAPRSNYPEDEKKCAETKKIFSQIDWPCEVKTLFQEKNLGCGKAPSSAINWFFDHVDQGIILEDDCLPSRSFFYFCQKMLEFYKHDSRIFQIGGTTYTHLLKTHVDSDYYFIRIPRIWGWATWKRAWEKYDFMMSSFPQFKAHNKIKDIFDHELLQHIWLSIFENTYNRIHNSPRHSAWDMQWVYAVLSQNGLCITPTKNLILNIGFGNNATHTKRENPLLSNNPTQEIDTSKLKHPQFVTPNKYDELWTMKHVFQTEKPIGIIWETKKIIKRLIRYGK